MHNFFRPYKFWKSNLFFSAPVPGKNNPWQCQGKKGISRGRETDRQTAVHLALTHHVLPLVAQSKHLGVNVVDSSLLSNMPVLRVHLCPSHRRCDNCCVTTVSKDRHRDTGQDNVSTASKPIIFIYLNMKFLYCDFVCSS